MVKMLNVQNKESASIVEGRGPSSAETTPVSTGVETQGGIPIHPEKTESSALRGEQAKESSLEKHEKVTKITAIGTSQHTASDPVVQVLKHISGYQPANSLAPINGAAALTTAKFKQHLQKVSSGDPQKAITWQAVLLLKILRVLFRI